MTRIESGQRKVTFEEAVEIADALGVTLAELAGKPEQTPRSVSLPLIFALKSA
jgi:hypothetical protein